jgi:hypothetical protein
VSKAGELLEQIIMAPYAMRIDLAKRLLGVMEAADARIEDANRLLARAQDGRAKRPAEANRDQVQLDYDIGQHLQRNGWHWDAINRQWRRVETATWTESRGRQP